MSILPLAGVFLASFVAALVVFSVVLRIASPPLAARQRRHEAPDAAPPDIDPQHITLTSAHGARWSDPAAARRLVLGLQGAGFRSVGVFSIEEMPGVLAQLFVQPEERFVGVVFEHPRSGHRLDVVEHRSDGSATTWTTAPDSGLEHAADRRHVHEPGATADALLARARRERGPAPAEPVHLAEVEALLERDYAVQAAWRKRRSTGGVNPPAQRGGSENRMPSSPSVTSPS